MEDKDEPFTEEAEEDADAKEEEDVVDNNKECGVRAFVFFFMIFAILSHDFFA